MPRRRSHIDQQIADALEPLQRNRTPVDELPIGARGRKAALEQKRVALACLGADLTSTSRSPMPLSPCNGTGLPLMNCRLAPAAERLRLSKSVLPSHASAPISHRPADRRCP